MIPGHSIRLNLSGNQVRSLPDLTSLAGLRELDLSFNPLDRDAPARIGALPALQTLRAEETGWTDVAPLRSARRLKRLILPRNPIGDISHLADLPGLEILDLEGAPIGVAVDRSEATRPTGPDVSPAVRAFCRAGRDLVLVMG